MRKLFIASLSVVSLLMTNCTTDGQMTTGGKVALGCIGGGALTYLLTRDAKKAVAGCVVGGIATAIALNANEKRMQEQAEERAFYSTERVSWQATQELPPADTGPSAPAAPPIQAIVPTAEEPVPKPPRLYSERNPHYCRTHRTICRRKDQEQLGVWHPKLVKPNPVTTKPAPERPPEQAKVVTASGYVIAVSTKINSRGQTCKGLEEYGQKNGKTAHITVTKCMTSTGLIVET